MCASWVAKSVGEDAKDFNAPDGVFDAHAKARERCVVFFFVFFQLSVFGFFVERVEVWMIILIALIAAVCLASSLFRQRDPAPSHRQIVHAARRVF